MTSKKIIKESVHRAFDALNMAFPGMLTTDESKYTPSHDSLVKIVKILGDEFFNGQLDDIINSTKFKIGISDANSAGAFTYGGRLDGEKQMILVNNGSAPLFEVVNIVLHEMIHMYDFKCGPMHQMLEKYRKTCIFNFNDRSLLNKIITTGTKTPFSDTNRAAARMNNFQLGIRSLPGELQTQNDDIEKLELKLRTNPYDIQARQDFSVKTHPRQYSYPGQSVYVNVGGIRREIDVPIKIMHVLDSIDGFVDAHGKFFQQYADLANSCGFDIHDVMTGNEKKRIDLNESKVKTYNPVRHLFDHIICNRHKFMEMLSLTEWFIEIA